MVVSLHREKTKETMAFLPSEIKYNSHQIIHTGFVLVCFFPFTEKKPWKQVSRTKYVYYPLI